MEVREAGPALDASLTALARAMTPADALIALDLGATDDTARRLRAFGEDRRVQLIRLGETDLTLAARLSLALGQAETPYLMALDPEDRLRAAGLDQLRLRLDAASPQTTVVASGWWFARPRQVLPRPDTARFATIPDTPKARDLDALCPDPRRCVLNVAHWREKTAEIARIDGAFSLYSSLIKGAERLAFVPDPAVLHPRHAVDPGPALREMARRVTSRPRAEKAALIDALTPWLDETALLTAPDQFEALLGGLETFSTALPRATRKALLTLEGPCGALLRARRSGGVDSARAAFALIVAAEDRARSETLALEVAALHAALDVALPGPDYLRDLYARLRGP